MSSALLEIVSAGALTTIQDLGRPGYAHLGVPRSGAADQPALQLANRLVGNPPAAAGLEITLTGCRLRFHSAMMIAVTGAAVTRMRVNSKPSDTGVPLAVPAGAVADIGPSQAGLRTYVAVAGGIDVPPVLGSRSTDTLSGLGPAVLRDGDILPVASPSGYAPGVWFTSSPTAPEQPLPLRVRLGPRDDWFTPSALETFTSGVYTVSTLTNRIGARLNGPSLTRAVPGELPSEGVVLGAVQVPADGQPLIFLADHPTTGGYPVIAVLDERDLPLIAQCRPGTAVTFVRRD